MSSFFETTADSFKGAEDIPFNDAEVVGFQCIDFNENATKKSLNLRVRVMTGDHKAKDYKIFLTRDDNEANLKRLSQFFHAFWTAEEIKTGSCRPAKLIGRKFTAKCSARMSKPKENQPPRMFRNWGDFQDRGASELPNGAATQSHQQATPQQTQATPVADSAGGLSF